MDQPIESPRQSVGAFVVLVSLLSFVPILGVLVGLICLIYGLVTPKKYGKAVAVVGALGICSTVALYGTLFHRMGDPKSRFGTLEREMLATQILPDLIKSIEYYKIQNGKYPASLDDLPPRSKGQVELQNSGSMRSQGEIYYELNQRGDKYYLGATGPDHRRFTEDDVLPRIADDEAARIGYTSKVTRDQSPR